MRDEPLFKHFLWLMGLVAVWILILVGFCVATMALLVS